MTSRSANQRQADQMSAEDNLRHALPLAIATHFHIKLEEYEVLKKLPSITNPSLAKTQGSLNDLRMGPVDKTDICKTCGGNIDKCHGHGGAIPTQVPIPINPKAATVIVKVLSLTCEVCGYIVEENVKSAINDYDIIPRRKRISAIHDKFAPKHQTTTLSKCHNCKSQKQYLYKLDENKDGIMMENLSGGQPIHMNFNDVYKHLSRIPTEAAEILGLPVHETTVINKPGLADATMLMTYYIYVIPNNMRSSVKSAHGNDPGDDFNSHYENILRVLEDARTSGVNINDDTQLQRRLYAAYYDMVQGRTASDQMYKVKVSRSINVMTKGKFGVLKKRVTGKVVDRVVRSVASPGPGLKFGEVGIPKSIASRMTIPERVNTHNIEHMRNAIVLGNVLTIVTYKQTKSPIDQETVHDLEPYLLAAETGTNINLKKIKEFADNLQVGDIVHRQIRDGDLVVVNRAPTIHAYSIHTCSVRIIGGSSIQVHMANTAPLGLDYDGDEIQLHLSTSLPGIADMELARIDTCGTNPMNSSALIGLVYDGLVGMFRMSMRSSSISVATAAQVLFDSTSVPDASITVKQAGTADILDMMIRYHEASKISETPIDVLRFDGAQRDKRGYYINLNESQLLMLEVFNDIANEMSNGVDMNHPILSKTLMLPDDSMINVRQYLYNMTINPLILFSCILPESYDYVSDSITIRDSVVIKGQLKKTNIGARPGTIVQDIYDMRGIDEGIEFITRATFMANHYLNTNPLTFTINDCYERGFYEPGQASGYVIKKLMEYVSGRTVSDGGVELITNDTIGIDELTDNMSVIADTVVETAIRDAQYDGTRVYKRFKSMYIQIVNDMIMRVHEEHQALNESIVNIERERENATQDNVDDINLRIEQMNADESVIMYRMYYRDDNGYKTVDTWKYVIHLISKIVDYRNYITQAVTEAQENIRRIATTARTTSAAPSQIIQTQIAEIRSNLRTVIEDRTQNMANKDTNLALMVDAGAKGDTGNIMMLQASITQAYIHGQLPKSNPFGQRLPSTGNESYDMIAEGFIMSNFTRGMNAREFFFHQLGTRPAIIDSALGTAIAGTAAADLRSLNRGVTVAYNNAVMIDNDKLIQFGYGSGMFSGAQRQVSGRGLVGDLRSLSNSIIKSI